VKNQSDIINVAKLFLKLGFTAFGGPAVHIAMMRQEVVCRRNWMGEQQFLDLIGATNLIPGPNSTEMAIHIGYERAGIKGLITAGLCFVIPAVFITVTFAWLYKNFGQLPAVQPFLYGVKPAIIAVILTAIFPLAKKSITSIWLGLVGICTLTLSLLGIQEIYLLFGAGALALLVTYVKSSGTSITNAFFPFLLLQAPAATVISASNLHLFWIFLKIGSILYGSGYVLFAFLDTELVSTGLLTRQQLIDAIAVGQFTPGPVFSAVTFVGYQINGPWGAFAATIGIFLPAFVFVALLNPVVKAMRHSQFFSFFLDAVNVASVAIIVSVCYQMGKDNLSDWRPVSISIFAIAAMLYFKNINSAYVVIGGAVAGYLLLQI
jgi:chromate transporter